MHGGTLFFMTVGVAAVFMVGCLVVNIWLARSFKWPPSVSKALLLATFFIGLAGILFGSSLLKAGRDMGGIRKIFVLPTTESPKLAVWCTRIYGKRVGSDYEQYIRIFDLMSGTHLKSLKVDPKYPSDDYRLYWPGGDKAWGYRKGPGIMLIDLTVPKIIADSARILKSNPALGRGFIPKTFIGGVDADQGGLYVTSANGGIYKLKEDLSAAKVTALPVDVHLKREQAFEKDWAFYRLKTSKGRHAHTRGSRCNEDKSLTLLEPDYLPEFNFAVTQKAKTWVLHKSALLGKYDWLMSYMEGDGTALNTINVSKLIQGEPLTVIGTYTLEEEILIFITTGRTYHSGIMGFSLAALSTDTRTGEYLRMISYF